MTTTAERIAELTAAWEDAVNYGELPEYHARASDYSLSEDDYRAGLSDDEAAEIVALIERQAENQKRAERIAARVLAEHDEEHRAAYRFGSPVAAMSAARKIATAAALAALTEMENAR